jgi:Kef-type K+ transport system membrane component KefB/Trk K+ transport system NAD-binding subunit
MLNDAFFQISFVLVLATVVGMIMRVFKQPPILSYIVSGILLGPAVFDFLGSNQTFSTFSSIGIALLLFIIGLGLNITVIKKLGKPVFVATLVELLFVGGLGFVASALLGFPLFVSVIVGLCLYFSSTIIIVKFLSDKKEQSRLHGQIAIGIVLLDDIVATFALLMVGAANGHGIGIAEVGTLLLHGLLLAAFLVIASVWVLPKLAKFMAGSQEMLFLFAIAWGFGVASLFELSGFSIEIGALFAGVSLASLPYTQEIESRLKPLRDFFVIVFFIVLGSDLTLSNLQSAIVPAVILSAIVLLLKPVSIVATLGGMGYSKRVSFMTGINISQISEFSIILSVLAVTAGVVPKEIGAIITLVAIITIAVSTYLMQYQNGLFAWFDKFRLKLFERSIKKRAEQQPQEAYPIILFGYHRGGHEFVRSFKNMHKKFLVVDYNPTVIDLLQHQHIPCQFGDATDLELLEEIGAPTAKLVVSTIADFETNTQIAKHLNLTNPDALLVCNATSYEQALQLYELGASYVMIPHYAGSERLGRVLEKHGFENREHFDKYRARHLKHLQARHPVTLAEQSL